MNNDLSKLTDSELDEKLYPRYELKYLITNSQKQAVLSFLKLFCRPDSFTQNGFYTVNTIYFDDENLSSYLQKINGDYIKTKYRLRYYNNNSFAINGEIKRKEGSWSKKDIYPLNIEKESSINSIIQYNQNSFVQNLRDLRLKPIIFIKYKREAYVSNTYEDIRITFDGHLSYSDYLSSINGKYFNLYPLRESLLEIKFRQKNHWITKLLAELNGSRVSFSKYCELLKYCNQNKNQMSGYEFL